MNEARPSRPDEVGVFLVKRGPHVGRHAWGQPRGFSCEARHILVASGFAPADALTAAEAFQIGIRAVGSTSAT